MLNNPKKLIQPKIEEVRSRIDEMKEDFYVLPDVSVRFPKGIVRVLGKTAKFMNRLALLGGFRVSELVTKFRGGGNTSDSLTLEVDVHQASGEEVLMIKVNTLKKKHITVTREVAIPLDPKYEPWSKLILDEWNKEDKNPINLSRRNAWFINSDVFRGWGYTVRPQVVYDRDEDNKLIRDSDNKPVVKKVIPEHVKPASDHFLRHIRANELRNVFQLNLEERVAFFSWSPSTFGVNPMVATYDKIDWYEYFPKFLRQRKL